MKFHFFCPNCGFKYSTLQANVGKKGKCRQCGKEIVVPNFENNVQPEKQALLYNFETETTSNDMLFNIIRIIASILLFVALSKQPYFYYSLLRVCIFLTGVYGVHLSYKFEIDKWIWIFGAITLIFNPIFPIYLDRGLWAVIDVATAIVLLASINYIPPKSKMI